MLGRSRRADWDEARACQHSRLPVRTGSPTEHRLDSAFLVTGQRLWFPVPGVLAVFTLSRSLLSHIFHSMNFVSESDLALPLLFVDFFCHLVLICYLDLGINNWVQLIKLGQTSGDSEGQRGLVCCCPWGHKESDMTGQLNNNN